MNILLNGICGHMGKEVVSLCAEGYRGARLVCGVDAFFNGDNSVPVFTAFDKVSTDEKIDCIVDFSHHSCTADLLEYAKKNGLPVVLATTGHTEEEILMIREASSYIPVFFSYNMSLGIALLVELAKKAALAMPEADIEIIEKHHNRKLDAPSGTAKMIADALCTVREGAYSKLGRAGNAKRDKNEIGVHAIRMGNVVGDHEVILATPNQTITLKHEAHSRSLFAEGALAAAEFMVGKSAGLYDMKSLVADTDKEASLVH